jgi:plasmid stabilization system protein ParE
LRIRFLPPAREEFQAAVRYYNERRASLGNEFRDEVWETLQRIEQFPLAGAPLGGAIRRCQTRRFPYGVIYEPLETEVIVIAVAHLHREPNYWRHRS